MVTDIFDFENYKLYLAQIEKEQERGFRARVARLLQINPAYVSQVLGGNSHFTLEQAESLNEMLGHSSMAADYFVQLVQLARAGTEALRNRIQKRLEQIRKSQLRLKERLQLPSLGAEAQSIYYSSWHYAAVHVAVSIPTLNSPNAIAASLGISLAEVNSALTFLKEMGLIAEEGGKFTLKEARLHLADDSPFIKQHHAHWRFKAVEGINFSNSLGDSNYLHYSSVVTISRKDIQTLRSLALDFLKTAKARIRDSKEEKIYGFNLDFFPVEARR